MKVSGLRADPGVDGTITLSWMTPPDHSVRVARHLGRFPYADDAANSNAILDFPPTSEVTAMRHIDGPLLGEQTYYYAVVAYDAAGIAFPDYTSARVVMPYGTAASLYERIPEIYRLLDRTEAARQAGDSESAPGALRRLMDIIGQPLDELRSAIASMRDLHDLDRVDGKLLPLLARWIGQANDTTLDYNKQRNEIRFAPQFYRTAGVPANLRAAINRYVSWDTQLKEMVHNTMLVTHPEWLTSWVTTPSGADWREPQNVNLDVAYEGRVSAASTRDKRDWLIYHARQSAPPARAGSVSGPDRWHIHAKLTDRGAAEPALRLTLENGIHKHPAAIARPDDALSLFYAQYGRGGGHLPTLRQQLVAVGRSARPAETTGTKKAPFALSHGDTLKLVVGQGLERTVTIRTENLPTLAAASAETLARLIDRELPGLNASADADGRMSLRSANAGAVAEFTVQPSTVATTLGLTAARYPGADGARAELKGGKGPFALADGMTLTLRVDSEPPRSVVFPADSFHNIAQAQAAEVVRVIESVFPGIADVNENAVRLRSPRSDANSLLAVTIDRMSVATALGFGVAVLDLGAAVADDHPSATTDSHGRQWLFWSSRRAGQWVLCYSRFDGTAWGVPKVLINRPAGAADHEPFALFDAAGGGRLWVFWTRRAPDGKRNVFSRSTTNLDFGALTEADWQEREELAPPEGYENREPAAAAIGGGDIKLFYTSNRMEGWNIWSSVLTPTAPAHDHSRVTQGPVTSRYSSPMWTAAGEPRLFFRSNRNLRYSSSIYPDAVTIDGRFSGSTTLDRNNVPKSTMRGSIADLQRYTMEPRGEAPEDRLELANRSNGLVDPDKLRGLYSRDVVAVYFDTAATQTEAVVQQRHIFADSLRRVLPIQVRLAFMTPDAGARGVLRNDDEGLLPHAVPVAQLVDASPDGSPAPVPIELPSDAVPADTPAARRGRAKRKGKK